MRVARQLNNAGRIKNKFNIGNKETLMILMKHVHKLKGGWRLTYRTIHYLSRNTCCCQFSILVSVVASRTHSVSMIDSDAKIFIQ